RGRRKYRMRRQVTNSRNRLGEDQLDGAVFDLSGNGASPESNRERGSQRVRHGMVPRESKNARSRAAAHRLFEHRAYNRRRKTQELVKCGGYVNAGYDRAE